ncbi:hypothetical protein ACFP2F_18840 [Hymenobacter artigasi]|uniref:SMODS-associated NUDIX domain-containing protein n=1 Tax=Hymenobacter artigasi TaxID=2719616 RepID=A0ABX1HKV1_9BACT|nr:hypothetical protein [Hymenobacter artigasi]NKI90888.1 hypothetical protein [Hymenobacter artigasi]
MPILARTDFTLGTKVLIYGATVGFGVVAAWSAVEAVRARDYGQLWVVSLPLLLGCAAGLVYALRHRLELTDTGLWQYGFRTKYLPLADIDGLVENLGAYEVRSAHTTIRLTTDLQDQRGFKDRVVAHLQHWDATQRPFPGRRLPPEDAGKLLTQVQHMVDEGVRTDTLFAADPLLFEQLTDPAYYLVYEHPVHAFLHRVYDAEGADVHAWLAHRSTATTVPGMNVFLLPHHVEWLVVYLGNGTILVRTTGE